MLFLIEIVLTIFAWRKGWRWYALIPLCTAVVIGFFLGFFGAISGADLYILSGGIVVVDIATLIALIIMMVKGPKSKEITSKLEVTNE